MEGQEEALERQILNNHSFALFKGTFVLLRDNPQEREEEAAAAHPNQPTYRCPGPDGDGHPRVPDSENAGGASDDPEESRQESPRGEVGHDAHRQDERAGHEHCQGLVRLEDEGVDVYLERVLDRDAVAAERDCSHCRRRVPARIRAAREDRRGDGHDNILSSSIVVDLFAVFAFVGIVAASFLWSVVSSSLLLPFGL